MADTKYNDYGTPHLDHSQVDLPMSLSSKTNTTDKKNTAWKSSGGVLSAQNFGTVRNFEDKAPTQAPESDKGASFGGA
jgi:hypothetical protein